jgi:hypothetical protein
LNESLLSKQLFKSVRHIDIFNTNLSRIQPNLFVDGFERLEKFSLLLPNFNEFITSNDNKWLETLGTSAKSGGGEILIEFHDIFSKYDYPNEHFCQYKHFEHEKLVFVKLIGAHIFYNCTCTIYWLIQNRDRSKFVENLYTTAIEKCFENNLSESIRSCQFEEKLRECERKKQNHTEMITGQEDDDFYTPIENEHEFNSSKINYDYYTGEDVTMDKNYDNVIDIDTINATTNVTTTLERSQSSQTNEYNQTSSMMTTSDESSLLSEYNTRAQETKPNEKNKTFLTTNKPADSSAYISRSQTPPILFEKHLNKVTNNCFEETSIKILVVALFILFLIFCLVMIILYG